METPISYLSQLDRVPGCPRSWSDTSKEVGRHFQSADQKLCRNFVIRSCLLQDVMNQQQKVLLNPSDSLGEKLPITQDILVHWAQTRFLGVGPPEFIRTFLQDSWAVPIKSCQEGCGGTCSINPASGREAGGAPVVWECSFSTECKSHWVNCQI
jgi:hypothetical protein